MEANKFLKTFKKLLLEAAETFNCPPERVNQYQFGVVSKGRLSNSQLRMFGYGKIKSVVFPTTSKTSAAEVKAIRALIAKLTA